MGKLSSTVLESSGSCERVADFNLTLEDAYVPDNPTINIEPTEINSIGVDAGLEYFVACSDGMMVEPPKFYRQAEEKLALLQAKRELRVKGSTARRKLNHHIARVASTGSTATQAMAFRVSG